jgi:hypothetical protein
VLRFISFFGFELSFCASWSWIRALAISEQARKKRSFSGGRFRFLLCLSLDETGAVMTWVAMPASALASLEAEETLWRTCCSANLQSTRYSVRMVNERLVGDGENSSAISVRKGHQKWHRTALVALVPSPRQQSAHSPATLSQPRRLACCQLPEQRCRPLDAARLLHCGQQSADRDTQPQLLRTLQRQTTCGSTRTLRLFSRASPGSKERRSRYSVVRAAQPVLTILCRFHAVQAIEYGMQKRNHLRHC